MIQRREGEIRGEQKEREERDGIGERVRQMKRRDIEVTGEKREYEEFQFVFGYDLKFYSIISNQNTFIIFQNSSFFLKFDIFKQHITSQSVFKFSKK